MRSFYAPGALEPADAENGGSKGERGKCAGGESEPQSGSDPMRGNEPEAGGGSDADERNEGGKAKE